MCMCVHLDANYSTYILMIFFIMIFFSFSFYLNIQHFSYILVAGLPVVASLVFTLSAHAGLVVHFGSLLMIMQAVFFSPNLISWEGG